MDTSGSMNQSTEPQVNSTKEFLPINPIEECLKAIGIVHGSQTENMWRYILARIEDARQEKLNKRPWSADRVQYILDTEVKYKDWHFVVSERGVMEFKDAKRQGDVVELDTDLRLRAEWVGADAVTGQMEKQQSRWWGFSKHAVKTEIIQTAFLCVLKAEEHEIRELFRYKDKAPFNSHIDIDTLASMSEDVDVRTDPRPEAPKNQRRE